MRILSDNSAIPETFSTDGNDIINFYNQVLKRTDEEKMKMYLKYPKKEIIKMLIESNKYLERLTSTIKYHKV